MIGAVLEVVFEVLKEALMISGFIFLMMLLLEFINVVTKGRWEKRLHRYPAGQHVLASLLGTSPGCLGAFAAVSLYSHRIVGFAALFGAMLATYGDAAFILMIKLQDVGRLNDGLLLFGILFGIGLCSYVFTAPLARLAARVGGDRTHNLHVHESDLQEGSFSLTCMAQQWRSCSLARGVLAFFLGGFFVCILSGELGPDEWSWERWTLLITSGVGVFIVSIVDDHFLQEHLWGHLVKVHLARIFLWTFGALLVCDLLFEQDSVNEWVSTHDGSMLVIACLVGLIPVSGPQLVFVFLYVASFSGDPDVAQVSFPVLLANGIVQDGDGMLPLLADSPRIFILIKAIKLVLGLAVGFALQAAM